MLSTNRSLKTKKYPIKVQSKFKVFFQSEKHPKNWPCFSLLKLTNTRSSLDECAILGILIKLYYSKELKMGKYIPENIEKEILSINWFSQLGEPVKQDNVVLEKKPK